MGADTHAVVENDDSLERGAQCKDAVSLVILLLFAHEEEASGGIVDHVLNLLLAARGVKWNRDSPHTVSAEIGIKIMYAVLREHGNVFLRFDSEVKHRITHLFHAQRELVPRHGFPFQTTEIAKRDDGFRAVFLCLFVYKYG